jgi:hypothetical protein
MIGKITISQLRQKEVNMYIVLGVLAIVFIILGFVGFIGGIPLLVFWGLALLCIIGVIKTYPRRAKGPYKATKDPE